MAKYYLSVDGDRHPIPFDTAREADIERGQLQELNPHAVIKIKVSETELPTATEAEKEIHEN
jgi:hypothetical protein